MRDGPARVAAHAYLRRGWAPIPVPFQRKRPILQEWQKLRLTAADLFHYFPTGAQNLGVLLGDLSGRLVDIDLDCPEVQAFADHLLPPTGAVFGRSSTPRAHRLYQPDAPMATAKFRDPTASTEDERVMLLELRSTGCQTLVPPSVHPSGEVVTWTEEGTPAIVTADELQTAVAHLAAAALLARHWPGAGSRHDAALALAGGLLRAGWSAAATERFVSAIAQTAGDDELSDRLRAAVSSAQARDVGKHTTGWPTLARLLDPRVVDRVRDWLRRNTAGHEDEDRDEEAGASNSRGREPTQATVLVDLAQDAGIDLFRDTQGEPYATLPVTDHIETWPLRAKTVRTHLARLFYLDRGRAPGSQALADALTVLDGEARFAGETHQVAVRLADVGDTLYLDLGDPAWRVVVIAPTGWAIEPSEAVPVRFRRPRGLLPLPDPHRPGSLAGLQSLLNLVEDDDWLLVVGWLLGCLYPRGPRPILQLVGEQGSAKSTQARTLRACVDPNVVPLRTQPGNEGDLLIAAINGAIVALDNLSHLPPWLSDALCRLATGGGLSKRELYTDVDEVLLEARRPVLLTGISEVAVASDLLDRTLTVTLPPIPPDQRRTEAELDAALTRARPIILGALLDAAVVGLRNLPSTQLIHPPRLADFATWVEACAPALGWEPGAFLDALSANRRSADAVAVEALSVEPVLLASMADRDRWEGTATALLQELNARISDEQRRERGWPKRANSLSSQLRRLAPNLRRLGINVDHDRASGSGQRVVVLTKNEGDEDRHSRHDRHNADETDERRDDDPSPPSSPHRHIAAANGPAPWAHVPECDDCDDGDDPCPLSIQCPLAGTTPRPAVGSSFPQQVRSLLRCYACGSTRFATDGVCLVCHPRPAGMIHGAQS